MHILVSHESMSTSRERNMMSRAGKKNPTKPEKEKSTSKKEKNRRLETCLERLEELVEEKVKTLKKDITERGKIEKKLKRYSKSLEKLVEERTRRISEGEERFRSVVDYASEAIITIDGKGNIVFWNKAAETIFGYSAQEAVGKPITTMMPKWARARDTKSVRQTFQTRKSLVGKTLELTALKKDETKFPIELSFSVWKTRESTFCTGIIRDVTERKRIENERKSIEKMLSALNSCGGKLNAAKSLDKVYDLTLDAMERTLGFEHASFMMADAGKLRPARQRGYTTPLNFALPLDGTKKGITVKAATTRKACLIPDVTKDKDYVKGDPLAPHSGSELAVPIMTEDQVLGVLNVESTKTDAFSKKDTMLLQILASHAATAISDLKKRDEIEKRSNQQTSLMRSSAVMIHSTDLNQRLQAILDAIRGLGWRRVVLSVRDENLNIAHQQDVVAAGLTDAEKEFLWKSGRSGRVWARRFGPEFERFKLGEFYYLLWSDPFVRKTFSGDTVSSHLKPEEMVDWDPDDLLYAALRLADGRIVGVVSIDDPVDGRRPTKDTLQPLELFLHQAAVAIENGRLIKQLNDAKTQIEEYANQLEVKVEERTRELTEAQKRLLKAERLATIGELAGMVGHDLRNPLTGITGAAYYLKTKLRSKVDKKAWEMLKLIEDDIQYSNKIINDLLEYSRDMRLNLARTNPKAMLKQTFSSIKIPKKVQILDRTQTQPTITVDVERMRRVLTNMIKNAFDAMPKGGKLTITSTKTKEGVALSFSDTGVGISEETMRRLWNPLFTTKAKGMGFGLPICKRIVESHGGNISVESTVDKGTMFTINIPSKPKVEEESKIWVNVPEPIQVETKH